MTSLAFRQLRQIELVMWFKKRFGKAWRQKVADAMGIPVIRTYRWFGDDVSSRVHTQIERWAYANGFQSVYDEALGSYAHHVTILNDVLRQAKERHVRENREHILPGAAMPLNQREMDQLIAGLAYKLVCER